MPSEHHLIGRGFDRLAGIYDLVVHLVFGGTIKDLELDTLNELPKRDRLLIIGGGTGRLLRTCIDLDLAEHYTYAELSSRMIERTKERFHERELERVHFTKNAFEEHSKGWDVIILPFVLDCYPEEGVQSLILEAKQNLDPGGTVVLLDFNQEHGTPYKPTWWKERFIELLYTFFHWTTSIRARQLPNFQVSFRSAGFKVASSHYRSNGWLQGITWIIDPSA